MDWFITSANAVSEDGEIVNIDGTGNRIAAITFGPKNVLFVISLKKVCKDLEAAVKRARSKIGERKFFLPGNNCEHFAIWCKTGVRQSYQVNLVLKAVFVKMDVEIDL